MSQINGIKILFQDREVSTVAISAIKLWNGGNEILEESDFYPEHELKIVIPQNEKTLVAAVTEETDGICKVRVAIHNDKVNEAFESFYCLNPQQGALINVYYTNINEKKTELIGKIKGGKCQTKQ